MRVLFVLAAFLCLFVALVAAEPKHHARGHRRSQPARLENSSDNSVEERGLISDLFKGGVATFFTQNGSAGACGSTHSDSDLIVALDSALYGNTSSKSSKCGKKVKITNNSNKKTVTCTVADACPTCSNKNSLDLSVAAFKSIASESTGEVPITWEFL